MLGDLSEAVFSKGVDCFSDGDRYGDMACALIGVGISTEGACGVLMLVVVGVG